MEEFSSRFLPVPYLCLHLAFSWEICLSAPLTLLFVLFPEDFEVQVLTLLTNFAFKIQVLGLRLHLHHHLCCNFPDTFLRDKALGMSKEPVT